jgi:hypothetical protein
MAQLESLTVKAFSSRDRREVLFASFHAWCDRLKNLGVRGRLWVDGSFLTEKLEPSDIDCVSLDLNLDPNRIHTEAELAALRQLLDHDYAKANYNLDFYLDYPPPEKLMHSEAYWKGLFGFQHDRVSAKGFVELTL